MQSKKDPEEMAGFGIAEEDQRAFQEAKAIDRFGRQAAFLCDM